MSDEEEILFKPVSSNYLVAEGFIEEVFELTGVSGKSLLAKLVPVLEHPSSNAMDKKKQIEFQRLEWLGDTILQFCVSELLMKQHPDESENLLNRRRIAIVREANLASWGRHVKLDLLLQVKGQVTDSIIGDSVEALIAVTYRNCGGMDRARKVCEKILKFETDQDPIVQNSKSILQDWCVAALGQVPKFVLKSQTGPDHRPTFIVEVTVEFPGGIKQSVEGIGTTKQLAEESACIKFFSSSKPAVLHTLPVETNLKGRLQERLGGGVVEYTLLPKLGPINAPCTVRIKTKGHPVMEAVGATKREAEAQAAFAMTQYLASNSTSTKAEKSFFSAFVDAELEASTDEVEEEEDNPKGRLQELLLNDPIRPIPVYSLLDRKGPDHAPMFIVELTVSGEQWGVGSARTKKMAEESAAREALIIHGPRLRMLQSPPPLSFTTAPTFARPPMSPSTTGSQHSYTSSSMPSPSTATAAAASRAISNPKGYLQERAIKLYSAMPLYIDCTHSHHLQGTFAFEVSLNGVPRGTGTGSTKKEAQENAARQAIAALMI
ncbi:hypothetical protein BASA81_000332 [Batrachochytrium salamandrivorans]|nr:hypothetical protein BASA81_000332 [Batrachochytrium salamandrivorans]